ncbi:hypothetical protein EG329_012669 [Mollisiaceae sp. DMI_Dod_QoI]|nr:hypothetical protein EG329_012669 [Helotiales sp. DMI_Dod_QoI]
MGSSTSKAAKSASKLSATNTARKYPTRPPPPSSNKTNVEATRPSPDAKLGPTVHPEVKASESRDQCTSSIPQTSVSMSNKPKLDHDHTPQHIQAPRKHNNPINIYLLTAINLDSSDPDLSLNARLRTLGPVQPNPTKSNSSTFNFARSPPLSHSDRATTSSAQSQSQFQPPKSSSHDPSLSHTQFQPSASNPLQSIFPPSPSTSASNSAPSPTTTSSDPSAQPIRQNAAVSLLTARYRLAEEAEAEFAGLGKKSSSGRRFLDVQTLRQVLVLRGEGMREEEIEGRLGLRGGVVGRLGREGVVGVGS